LRNPLAEPATLGVSSGAFLALAVATFLAPDLLAHGREEISLLGAGLAMATTLLFAWSNTVAPTRFILAGLVVNMVCGAIATTLAIFHDQGITALFLWTNGSLVQRDWSGVAYLLPRLICAFAASVVILRPLTLSGVDDRTVESLGLSASKARLGGLAIAVAVCAFVVSVAGNIGFIGLVAPALAQLSGGRRFRDRLLWSPLIGAGLLWLADQLASRVGVNGQELPAGVAAALIGVPFLLLLLLQNARTHEIPVAPPPTPRARSQALVPICLLLALIPGVLAAVTLGRGVHGWVVPSWQDFQVLAPWRLPRVVGALSTGAMLAVAGCLIQGLTGNPMAGPETLGVGAGGVFAVMIAILAGVHMGPIEQLATVCLGAMVSLVLVLGFARRSESSPARMLLVGVAINTLLAVAISWFIGSGDPRASPLLRWVSGSTYLVTEPVAMTAFFMAIALLGLAALLVRWIEIWPLGMTVARSLGVGSGKSRALILLVAAMLTAGGTSVAGPSSFIGLMSPHLATMLGVHRPLPRIVSAAVLGGFLFVAADWVGRMALFPNEAPAGLVASLIGAPCFLWLMRKRSL
jgi:iron complex transport system permease protein